MLIGLLSDAHGNPLSVRRCLRILRSAGAEEIRFLGDAVGYLPGGAEVIDILADADVVCQQGNHEAMLLGRLAVDARREASYQLSATARHLKPRHWAELASWPDSREVTIDGRRILFVHGTPRDPLTGYFYPDGDLADFDDVDYDAVLMGNTHRPFVATRGNTTIANVGSCGLPRDQGDLPSCALFDTVANTCRVLRTRVSAAAVVEQFGGAGVTPLVMECLRRHASDCFGELVAA